MKRTPEEVASLAPADAAPQQGGDSVYHSPRPLPLFLELVRQVSQTDPALARRALDGLEAYGRAPRAASRRERPPLASLGGATLRDHKGSGAPLLLIPSLINPPGILDLDADTSLADALAAGGRHVLLLDWGPADARAQLDVAGHVETILVPLLEGLGEPAVLVGYCLGGTMAIAAANLVPVERLVTLAAPWHFARYPADGQAALGRLWDQARATAGALGALPMEVLQSGFWALDPERTVAKFAKFAALAPDSDEARRFVALEDWANEGEPLPLPAARELFEAMFRDDVTGAGQWRVGGQIIAEQPPVPALHLLAGEDRIVPAATAAAGEQKAIAAGHVGMIVGRARAQLHEEISAFLGH